MAFNLKHIIQKLRMFKEKDSTKRDPNPYRDWTILITSFFATLILIGIGNVLLFYSFQNKGEENITPNIPLLNREELRQVLNFYATKQAHLETDLKNLPTLADPSL